MTAGVSLFQSTLPARGATGGDAGQHRHRHFNPRSPHGERRGAAQSCVPQRKISIHAPRTGSDVVQLKVVYRREKFQSTLPARGATIGVGNHTARTLHFNPRSPHGERPSSLPTGRWASNFNPRSPHGERPAGQRKGLLSFHFNPRSPHGERRPLDRIMTIGVSDFNPRSPHGERRVHLPLLAPPA